MKTKVRLCKLVFSTRLLVSLLIILGILEGLQWLQGEGKSSKSLLLSDYPELSSSSMMSSSSSNFASSAGLPGTAVPASELAKVKIEPEKKSTDTHQNILLLAYARSGKLHILIQRVFVIQMVKSLLWRLLFHGRAFVSWYKGSLLLWTTV